MGQESHALGQASLEAAASARAMGWKMIQAPAQPGKGKGTSGGVMVLAREWIGLSKPDDVPSLISPGRAVAARVEFPGFPPFLAVSLYLYTGQALEEPSLSLMQQVGEVAAASSLPVIVGGDFQACPQDIASLGFHSKLCSRILSPKGDMGTCRGGSGSFSCIDYFVCEGNLSKALCSVEVDLSVEPRPHRPVVASFRTGVADRSCWVFKPPPAIPKSRVYGPLPRPPAWEGLAGALRGLRSAVGSGCSRPSTRQKGLLDEAYSTWARLAEIELEGITGVSIKRGCRSGKPVLVRKAMDGQGPCKSWASDGPARQLRWIRGRALELQDLVQSGAEPSGSRCRQLLGIVVSNPPSWLAQDATEGGWKMWLQKLFCSTLGASGGQCLPASLPASFGGHLAQLEQELDKAEASERSERSRTWSNWAKDAVHGSASKGHKFTRIPQGWEPTVAQLDGGTTTGEPRALLEDQRKAWAKLWTKGCSEPFSWPSDLECPPLPALTPRDLRKASQAFPVKTAGAPDGYHVRHFGLLSDGALEALAELIGLVEDLGVWPDQVAQLVVAMLEKPAGGFRPIGLFPALYRLWMKARVGLCRKWESTHDLPCFAMGKGRSATDTVWRQAVLSEAAVGKGDQAAVVLWDLVKFYESISHARLLTESISLGYPLRLLRLNLAGYNFPRHLSLAGMTSQAVCAMQGVVAGCGAATTLVKVFYYRPFLDFGLRHPRVVMDVFIDDTQVASQGREELLVEDIVEATSDLASIIEGTLGSQISLPKAAVVASSNSVAAKLRRALKAKAGAETYLAKNLGVDCSAARPRAWRSRAGTRHKRLAGVAPRLARLRRLVKAGARKAGKVYRTGIQPQATFGCEVNGLSDGEVARLQKSAASAFPPFGRLRSRTLVLLAHGDPLAKPATAAMCRWAKEVWLASCGQEGRALPLSRLSRLWRLSLCGPKGWRSARGPMAVARLEAKRLGWSFDDPFTLVTAQGHRIPLTEFSPRMVQSLAVEAHHACLEARAATKLGVGHVGNGRITLQPVCRLVRSKKLTGARSGLLRAAAVGGLCTASLQREMGYQTDGICALCHGADDTPHHRLYSCPAVEQDRAEILAEHPGLLDRAVDAGQGSLLYERCVLTHPEGWPQPISEEAEVFLVGGRESDAPREMAGDIYVDGACYPDPVKGNYRAGWAVVQKGAGEQDRVLYGPVWPPLPQSSQAAEWVAYAVAHQCAVGDATVHTDCSNVSKDHFKPLAIRLSPDKPYAGIVKSTMADPGWLHVKSCSKVKAHCRLSADMDDEAATKVILNSRADHFAKLGAQLHHAPSEEASERWQRDLSDMKAVAKLICTLWVQWPKLPKLEKVQVPCDAPVRRNRRRLDPRAPKHVWRFGLGRWQCVACSLVARSDRAKAGKASDPCPAGSSNLLEELASSMGGHKIFVSMCDDLPLVFCAVCAKWGTKRVGGLRAPCTGVQTVAGKSAIGRISSERHPVFDLPLGQAHRLEVDGSLTKPGPRVSVKWQLLLDRVRSREALANHSEGHI